MIRRRERILLPTLWLIFGIGSGLSLSLNHLPVPWKGLPSPSEGPVASSQRQPKTVSTSRREAMSQSSVAFLGALLGGMPRRAFASDNAAATTSAHRSQYSDGPRGLKYLVLQEGDDPSGPKPQRAQKVKCNYALYLGGFPEDGGKLLDSSKGLFGDRAFEFYVGVSQVIKGWDLALLDMKEGEVRRLVVPSELGYGEKGAGNEIPGGATLYFEVKLANIGDGAKPGPDLDKWLDEHPL